MLTMMSWSFASTSSKVQDSLKLFWLCSRPEVATPPAFAALPGMKRIFFSTNRSVASLVDGMLAPSATAKQPFAISALASSKFSSFWVAHGSAMSHGMVQIPLPSVYFAVGTASTYSLILPRRPSLISFTTSSLMPSGSYT